MNTRKQLLLFLFAVSPSVFSLFALWSSTTRVGSSYFLAALFVSPLLILLVVPAVFVLAIRDVIKNSPQNALIYMMMCLVFIASWVAGIFLGQRARILGIHAFPQKSQPLIAAIKKYEQDNSTPPRTLQDLVPNYLPAIPSTGMGAYPDYRYFTGNEAQDEFPGKRWVLSVFTPGPGINFDQILYFPDQNYPETGFGGSLERIGDWAYVHE